jgi:hypothetical protein
LTPYPAKIERISVNGGNENQMRETIRRMGSAIRAASVYPPIRNFAAAIATKAGPKDFIGQLRQVYDEFTRRWRYVKDPVSRELLTNSPEAIWRLTIGGDGVGVGAGKGAGDCDCAAIALGALLESIGFKTQLGTTADSKAVAGRLFGHVFIRAFAPGLGWITLDPVLFPKKPFGSTASHSRIAFWNLDGKMISVSGNYRQRRNLMNGPNIEQWQDYGFGGVDSEETGEPMEWSMLGLSDWGWMKTPQGPISTVNYYGYIDGSQLSGMMAEVDENDDWGGGLVRTPMLELAIDDYDYMLKQGTPYDGMLALGDTGEIYHYDGSLGFFKKLFRRVKKKVKKVARRVKKGIKKVLKKSKFGRMLLKIGGKIRKIAMKVVRPLMKFVGKWAAKLAPIAAMIPGYGTAIAGALAATGKIANLMKKYGVKTTGKKGKVRNLKLKNPKMFPAFQRNLKREAKRMKQYSRGNPRKFRKLATSLAKR